MKIRSTSVLAYLACSILGASAVSAQRTWIVKKHQDQGVDFVEIQSAVNAAADGDFILVGPGSYRGTVIDGKSLVIQAEPGEDVDVSGFGAVPLGSLTIQNIGANQRVAVRGIDAPVGAGGGTKSGLIVKDCSGPVLVEDAYYEGTAAFPGIVASGVLVLRSSSVTLVDCTIQAGFDVLGQYDNGLQVTDSVVHALSCSVTGENGVALNGGELFFSGSTATGLSDAVVVDSSPCVGDPLVPCPVGIIPPDSIANPELTTLDAVLAPSGGGLPVRLDAGSLAALTGKVRSFSHSSPVREGESTVEVYTGAPSELVFWLISPTLLPGTLFPTVFGTSHLGTPNLLIKRGVVPASGILTRSLTINELGPGVEGFQLFGTAIFVDVGTLNLRLANPTSIVLVDSAF